MKRIIVVAVAIAIVLAFVAGFWPEHRRFTAADVRVHDLEARLAAAEDRIRLAEVLGQLLRLSDAVDANNYGEASSLSSTFFDAVRAEASRNGQASAKQALDSLLRSRDQVTTAIARTDPALATTLKDQQRVLRRALGYAVAEKPPSGGS